MQHGCRAKPTDISAPIRSSRQLETPSTPWQLGIREAFGPEL